MRKEVSKMTAAVEEFLAWKKAKHKPEPKPQAKSAAKSAPPASKKKRAAREDIEE